MAQPLNLDDLLWIMSYDVNLSIITIFCIFGIDDISNGYTLITIHGLKPWALFAFKESLMSDPFIETSCVFFCIKYHN